MKTNLIRYSSAVGEAWVHAMFKVKYCHNVFDNFEVRACADRLFKEAFDKYGIRYGTLGFDADHVHATIDLGLRSKPQIAKLLKGYTGSKILKAFPEMERRKFYGGGFWNPSYYMDSSRGLENITNYVNKQKYGLTTTLQDQSQTKLATFA